MTFLRYTYLITLILFGTSCATFYEINYEFNQNFEEGNIERAQTVLNKNKKRLKKKGEFLYYANHGVVSSMLKDYENSNVQFEKAYLYGEDYRQNPLNVAASFLVNPKLVKYPGEDHEHLLLLYYKALNYLKLGDKEAALVECKRLNNRLNDLSDRYKSDKKYKRDAFIHNLMGIIYEANGEYNNAFIAYRNAYDIYQEDFTQLFALSAPEQLKQDLLRSAYLTGFDDQVRKYEKEFGVKYQHQPTPNGELVFFWHNGLGPIKDEWSVNFTVLPGGDGVVTFVNEDFGFNFPFAYDYDEEEEGGSLTDLEFFRVAFPKYVERPMTHSSATLKLGKQKKELELAEDINAIAFKSLEQRMVWEFGKSLLRAALKKATEKAAEDESEGLGLVVGLINAITEQADTRNWQTIPHSIYYTRMPLNAGENKVSIQINRSGTSIGKNIDFTFAGQKGKTVFHTYQTLY
ncbi:MAG: hypothetical protein R8G66_01030 [Cytophagales bacterium]|nr:hypothetical protein [Cytophagales bacterium]